MNFLDEGTFVGKNAVADALKDSEFKALKSDEKAKAIAALKQGGSITTEKKGKDLDGDGDIDSDDYLAARDKAIKKAIDKKVEEGKLSSALGGIAVLASLLLLNKISSNDPVIQRLQAEYEQAEPSQQDSIKKLMTKRLIFLDTGKSDSETPMDEGLGDKVGNILFGRNYQRPFSDFMKDINSLLNKDNNTSSNEDNNLIKKIADIEKGNLSDSEFELVLKKLKKAGMSSKELRELENRFKIAKAKKQSKKKTAVKEEKTIELPSNTTFTLDLKHLMKKHLDEGKSQEDVIKLTKALMKKLHNKGEVKVDGTKLIFKEADIPQDTQLALPEPPAKDFLGDDGKDYEGGMAKSQMLKMKKYAMALCDMVDDESQLEAWVQAKITKASDYMSAVYHYLDYQNSKMDENLNLSMQDTDEILVSILMGEANLSEETAEQVVDGLSSEDFKKAGLMMIRGIDERQIAKFILSATTLDENSKVNESNLVPAEEWKQLNIDWEMVDVDEHRPDFQSGPLYGTTSDGREFESYGYYTEFEGLVVDDDVYEI